MLTQQNRGIVAALNAGLESCTAEFVARLDADDVAARDRLERQLLYLRRNPRCVAVSGAVRHIDEHGRPNGKVSRQRASACSGARRRWSPTSSTPS